LALQTPKFYLAGSIEPKVCRVRKSGFLRSIDRKKPQFEQALTVRRISMETMLPDIKAVAFDLDGTLYPNHSLYRRLLPFILQEWQLLAAFGRARNIIRAGQESGRQDAASCPRAGFYGLQAQLTAKLLKAAPLPTQEKIERLIYRGWEHYFKEIKLFPRVAETLAALRQAGLKLGLLSDFPPETKLEYLGIAGFWDAVLCSERTGMLKPAARPFLDLAAALGLPPGQVLYVGNSRRCDIAGARRAGMRAALVTGRLSLRRSAADYTFHDYRQLRGFVLH
jgi:putative hydrolase of the HAD superfamily